MFYELGERGSARQKKEIMGSRKGEWGRGEKEPVCEGERLTML